MIGDQWHSLLKNLFVEIETGEYFKLHERTFQHIKIEDIEKLFHYSYKNSDYKYDFKKYRDKDGTNEILENGTEEGSNYYIQISSNQFLQNTW